VTGSQQFQLRQGDVIAKKYEIETVLGSGPLGPSYVARSLTNGKKLVVKLLAGPAAPEPQVQDIVARFKDIQSDAIVRILDTGEISGRRWVVTEYVEGESLRRLMDEYAGQRKPFSLQEACQLVAKVLEAMAAAHAAGLVHRHLKPVNVHVFSRNVGPGQGRVVRTVKVSGLGLSELVHPSFLQEGIAERPADARYMAPEISSPSAGGTGASDIYSAGVIFYELLCGQTPIGSYLSPSQIRDDLNTHVDNIVDIAIAANAEDRYPTARDMLNDIQRAIQQVEDKPVGGLSRRALGLILAGTLAVAGAIGAVLYFTDPDAGAARADKQLRKETIDENGPLDDALIRKKLEEHPGMVYIPAGSFIKGRLNSEKLASGLEPVAVKTKLPAYFIDQYEYENQKGGHAAVNLTWQQASDACAAKGKRLCTADEWERACKGPESLIYTYGDTFNADTCGADVVSDTNPRDDHADRASGDLADCKSGFMVYDMSGGVREWTSTPGRSDPTFRVLKGGKPGEAARASRCGYIDEHRGTLTDRGIGVRCCLDDADATSTTPGATTPAGDASAPAPAGGAAPGGAAPADGAAPAGATPADGGAPAPAK
jgi:serine/threonine protein kinase